MTRKGILTTLYKWPTINSLVSPWLDQVAWGPATCGVRFANGNFAQDDKV